MIDPRRPLEPTQILADFGNIDACDRGPTLTALRVTIPMGEVSTRKVDEASDRFSETILAKLLESAEYAAWKKASDNLNEYVARAKQLREQSDAHRTAMEEMTCKGDVAAKDFASLMATPTSTEQAAIEAMLPTMRAKVHEFAMTLLRHVRATAVKDGIAEHDRMKAEIESSLTAMLAGLPDLVHQEMERRWFGSTGIVQTWADSVAVKLMGSLPPMLLKIPEQSFAHLGPQFQGMGVRP